MKQTLDLYRREMEDFFTSCLQDESIPPSLAQAMRYSLMAGGKRIRPVLCLVWAEYFGRSRAETVPFAAGLELIHTYSLVHDDLPAMDDDAVRRGQPSNHVQHGEALAILAGDGLLTEAFALMLSAPLPSDQVRRAALDISHAAGPRGMVGGQVVDMGLSGGKEAELDELQTMHAMKTGAMIRSSCRAGAILGQAEDRDLDRVTRYGECIGLAFQVADDILDVVGEAEKIGKPVGSDLAMGKATYPALIGLEESRRLGQAMVQEALRAVQPFQGPQIDFLRDLAGYIMDRVE
ncbi:polyprenyl synthetase family protein [Desulfovermiculus halophilus]|jgi:geranylgeranyl diphosphate synthase type II|uniref:polyprenyl synthetase family protein n=1 Tax=Desulfovermiculus halophilus TaxID=339722 RepID=UPI0004833521|nr:farnesyl diphosphate synthase [Desulfovermiculus halophilus]